MNFGKRLTFGDEARNKLIEGVNELANAVKTTLGPRGKTVVIEKNDIPHVTKDGVSVAKVIRFSNREKNLGARMIREVSEKAAKDAGDGTTTATVLTQALVVEGQKLVTNNINSNSLKRGIDFAVEKAVEYIKSQAENAKGLDELEKIAIISANGDTEIGLLLREAMEKVGTDGTIILEKSAFPKSSLEYTEGMKLKSGWLSKYFVTDETRMICEYQKPKILLIEKKVNFINPLVKVISSCMSEHRPLVIVAEDFSDTVLKTIIGNKVKGLECLCVKNPAYGYKKEFILDDLAAMSGATPIIESRGKTLDIVQTSDLGELESVFSRSDFTIFKKSEDQQESVNLHVAQLKNLIENSDDHYQNDIYKSRIAAITTGVAVIKIGGSSEMEVKEKYDRFDDALCAMRAADAEGIVPGGGTMLLKASKYLKTIKTNDREKDLAINLVAKAMRAPIRQIIVNGGEDPEEIVSEILMSSDKDFGYNAATNKFTNLKEDGVIDPVKVVRCALQDAASVAGLILTTDCIIVNEAELNEFGTGEYDG